MTLKYEVQQRGMHIVTKPNANKFIYELEARMTTVKSGFEKNQEIHQFNY